MGREEEEEEKEEKKKERGQLVASNDFLEECAHPRHLLSQSVQTTPKEQAHCFSQSAIKSAFYEEGGVRTPLSYINLISTLLTNTQSVQRTRLFRQLLTPHTVRAVKSTHRYRSDCRKLGGGGEPSTEMRLVMRGRINSPLGTQGVNTFQMVCCQTNPDPVRVQVLHITKTTLDTNTKPKRPTPPSSPVRLAGIYAYVLVV